MTVNHCSPNVRSVRYMRSSTTGTKLWLMIELSRYNTVYIFTIYATTIYKGMCTSNNQCSFMQVVLTYYSLSVPDLYNRRLFHKKLAYCFNKAEFIFTILVLVSFTSTKTNVLLNNNFNYFPYPTEKKDFCKF